MLDLLLCCVYCDSSNNHDVLICFKVGLGIHGEAGIRREVLPEHNSANHVSRILVETVLKSGSFEPRTYPLNRQISYSVQRVVLRIFSMGWGAPLHWSSA